MLMMRREAGGCRNQHVGARGRQQGTLPSERTNRSFTQSHMASKKRKTKALPATPPPAVLEPPPSPPAEVRKSKQILTMLRYPELRRLYLEHVAKFGDLTAAAAYIRLSYETIDLFRQRHPWFGDQIEAARKGHRALIEQTIHQRAIDGWDEPRFGKFGIQGYVRRYSDQLLIAYARRHIPEYREGDVTRSTVEGEVVHKHSVDANALTPKQRDALRLLLEEGEEPEQIKQITLEPNGNAHS